MWNFEKPFLKPWIFQICPVAQPVEHDASNTKFMGLNPWESKNWSNVNVHLECNASRLE